MATYGPELVVGDLFQVTFRMRLGDQIGLNVRHWQVAALSSVGDNYTNRVSDAIASSGAAAAYKALIADDATFDGFSIRKVQPSLGLEYVFTDGAGVGTGGVAPLPRQCAGFIRLRSMSVGRGKSGRAYVPFPTESQCQPNGKPEEAYMVLLDALGIVLAASLLYGTGGVLLPVIYTRPDDDAIPPVLPSVSGVRSALSVQAFATQRRRGTFGRPNPLV